MEYPCVVCDLEVEDHQEALECDSCNRWQHRTCDSRISQEFYWRVINDDEVFSWTCRDCTMPNFTASITSETFQGPIFESTRVSLQESVPQLNDELLEESLQDTQPAGYPILESPVVYTVTEKGTQRGKSRLTTSLGYAFVVRNVVKQTRYWTCSVRNKATKCKATVVEKNGIFKAGALPHIHPARPGITLSTQIVTEAKKVARDNIHQSAPALVEGLLQERVDGRAPCPALPSMSNIAKAVNRDRQKLRPKEPTDLNFELATDSIPEQFLIGDIRVSEARHVVFASPKQLEMLSRAKTWYLDATFKIVKQPFTQLFSIHAFVRSDDSLKQVPLAFALMSRRRRKDYKKVFQCLKDQLPTVLPLTHAVCDFEGGIWRAFREVFPSAMVKGCAFHWTQAVFRKVQGLGLEPAYRSDDGTYKLVRKLLSLPMVPAGEVLRLFNNLKEDYATSGELVQLFDYIESTWMRNSIWSTEDWCVFGRAIRTNNDVEGWHHRINSRAGRANVQFYLLIDLLWREADLVRVQARLVSEGKLTRIQRKSTRDSQGMIFELWQSYQEGSISSGQLLRRISRLNGPISE